MWWLPVLLLVCPMILAEAETDVKHRSQGGLLPHGIKQPPRERQFQVQDIATINKVKKSTRVKRQFYQTGPPQQVQYRVQPSQQQFFAQPVQQGNQYQQLSQQQPYVQQSHAQVFLPPPSQPKIISNEITPRKKITVAQSIQHRSESPSPPSPESQYFSQPQQVPAPISTAPQQQQHFVQALPQQQQPQPRPAPRPQPLPVQPQTPYLQRPAVPQSPPNRAPVNNRVDSASEVARYYYPPRQRLPLPKCFHNPTGYVCCNEKLNDLMVETYTELEARPKFHTCNVQALATHLQLRAEKEFDTPFETIAGFEDFAQKIHFKSDLVCKVELGGRYMLAYATFRDVTESRLPPIENRTQEGPANKNRIVQRNSIRI